MKKRLLILMLACAMAFASSAGYSIYPQASAGPVSTVWATEKNPVQRFGYQLMEQHLTKKNPVMSPVSAYVMLSMVGNGAKGTTKKEFQKVLGSDMLSVSKSLMDTLPQEKDSIQLTIANSAWMDKKFTAKNQWLGTVKNQLQSDVFRADLGTDGTKNKINKWVSSHTNNLIPKLLDKKLDKGTRLALLNALYFHADWEQQFQAENTTKNEFRLDDGTIKNTDMMHGVIYDCGYFKDRSSEGVVLPYQDSSFAFVAVKPAGDAGIRDWYASYTAEKLAALIETRETKMVELALPKFQTDCRMNMNDSLKKIGIKRAFQEKKADLSLLGKSQGGENLYLNLVLQEAVISVAEEGTEAAAASMGGISAGSAYMPDRESVHFDRSFLYMIMDMESGTPVFMGILDQP